jgi:predicted RNase H-like HicB family nuclease
MVAVVALIHGKPGTYGISFPDFPGCIAGGASVDEALRRGRDALDFHVESMMEVGEVLPKIRDIAEIKADPDYTEDFADAVVAVVDAEVPAKAVLVNISIDERLLDRIDRAAQATGETRSGFMAAAARERLSPDRLAGQVVERFEETGPAYRHQKTKLTRVNKKRKARKL